MEADSVHVQLMKFYEAVGQQCELLKGDSAEAVLSRIDSDSAGEVMCALRALERAHTRHSCPVWDCPKPFCAGRFCPKALAMRAVPYVLKRANHEDAMIRLEVAFLLKHLEWDAKQTEACVGALIGMLGDKDFRVRLATVDALVAKKRDAAAAAEKLCAMANDPDRAVAQMAVEAAQKIVKSNGRRLGAAMAEAAQRASREVFFRYHPPESDVFFGVPLTSPLVRDLVDQSMPKLIRRAVQEKLPTSEAMRRVCTLAMYRAPHPVWEEMARLPYDEEVTQVGGWLADGLRNYPCPGSVDVLWISLLDETNLERVGDSYVVTQTRLDMQLAGLSDYDIDALAKNKTWISVESSVPYCPDAPALCGPVFRGMWAGAQQCHDNIREFAEYQMTLATASFYAAAACRQVDPQILLGRRKSRFVVAGWTLDAYLMVGEVTPEGFKPLRVPGEKGRKGREGQAV